MVVRDSYKRLGEYIRPIDQRNRDLAITNLLGVSIEKRFIPSIANIVGTDLSNYKIVRTGQFAYGPVTSRNGEKVSIALLDEKDCIISSSYSVFEVIDKETLDPSYDDEKMRELARRVKTVVDDKTKYTDCFVKDDIKASMKVDLILLLDEFGYPPVTMDDVYKEVLEQAENFKKYAE